MKSNVGSSVRLTRRARALITVVAFAAAAGIGLYDPLWSAMPWAVTP